MHFVRYSGALHANNVGRRYWESRSALGLRGVMVLRWTRLGGLGYRLRVSAALDCCTPILLNPLVHAAELVQAGGGR